MKIEEIQEKKFIDRNWTITTCLLRDSNPHCQCLKITSCRWRPPPSMHSFTATTHFKSSRSFVSPSVCCLLCRMRLCRILQSMQHTLDYCLFKGQVVMVQFLSIFFFLDFLNFCWFFQNFPLFCVTLYLFTASLLYMFRVSIAPIIWSTKHCKCSFWYRS